jgi:hypothetical protein
VSLESQVTELMDAVQIGRFTASVCDWKPLGGVMTSVPTRGHPFPLAVSIAYASTSALATSPGLSVR